MINAISHSLLWVFDQDEALDFYVGKLGFEIHTDAQLEHMRFLTVNAPGDPNHEVMLMLPKPPVVNEANAEAVRDIVAKGHGGGGLIVTTDDCRGDYEKLVAQGVEFTEEPTERFYGIDCAMRDPFGNSVRMTQPA
ncbi:MAG TPA: VOC family protein [Thermoleophilaceae bacterium]|nr:VOC family protein [Thermoleophilaceae bacterium]